MLEFLQCDKEHLDKAIEEVGDIKKQAVPTKVEFIDSQCYGLLRSRIILLCAPSGHGKSTVMVALAKSVASDTNKVLYITVEQEPNEMLVRVGTPNANMYITRIKSTADIKCQWDDIKDYVKKNNISFIFYDYIGATGISDNAVSEMVNEMNSLSDYAIDTKCGIITACQASLDLIEYYTANKDKTKPKDYLYTSKFIAFSKHIADKASAAFYIIKDNVEKDWIHVFCFKNRCFEHKCTEYQDRLFYDKCEFYDRTSIYNICGV